MIPATHKNAGEKKPAINAAVTAPAGFQSESEFYMLPQISTTALMMTSREIAQLIEKQHNHIKVSADRLAEKGVIGTPAVREFTHNGNTYTEYLLNKRDSLILVAQNCPEFTARIVDRWQELEAQASTGFKVPTTLSAALRLAADQADTIEAQQVKLAITTPKAEALDRITLSDGSMCLTNAAKVLGMPPKKFIDWMQQHEWIYRRAGSSKHIGYQSRVQAGYLDHKVTTVSRTDGTEKTVEQVLVTTKGLAKLAKVVGAGKQPGLFGGEAA